jgi:F0F1-type ATP synthase assembly protein I
MPDDFHSRNLIDAILKAEAFERDIAEREAEARKRWRKFLKWFGLALAFTAAIMIGLSIGFFLGGLP